MKIVAKESETFILLNGIEVSSDIILRSGVVLQPADTSHLDFKTALKTCSHPDDIAVVAAFIPRVRSQFKIASGSETETAALAWNASWDALLLSAVFQTEIGFNIQSDTTASKISSRSKLRSIHRGMNGFNDKEPYRVREEDVDWLEQHYIAGSMLFEQENFQTAVQSMASHYWHPNPRIKLAILWAGIESLFSVSSEIRFRISVSMARFLYPNDVTEMKNTYDLVKKLYNDRSLAVHGGKLKGSLAPASAESANLLRLLIRKCIETRGLPKEEHLFP